MNSRWNNSSTLLSVAAISALALSSCASEDMDSEEDEAQPTATVTETVEAESTETPESGSTEAASPEEASPEAESTGDPSASSETDGEDGIYQAVDAVTQEYPDAVIMDMDTEGNAYEFTIFEAGSEWELNVDRESFEISNAQEDDIDADDQADAEAVETDFTEALRTAGEEGGGAPEQADLNEDNGTVTWEIELDNGSEVHVDVATGEVARVED